MKNNFIETVIGGIVLVISIGLIVFAYIKTNSVYGVINLTAEFEHVSGLNVGSEVRVSGMKVGKITKLTINPETYNVTVGFLVNKSIGLTGDSIAKIEKDSILGNTNISIEPGGDISSYIKDGDHITITESAVNIMDLISNIITNFTSKTRLN